MNVFIRTYYCRILFILLLLCLIIFKLQFLNLPFFWDESWVYAPSLRMMHDNGPSLMPNVIPVDYSRGHPLLFHFLGGVWLKIFGTSLISFHSFALFISILVIIFFFLLSRSMFNEKVALLSTFLLITLQMFVVQSSFVLPEMLLTLWMIISIFTFFKKKWWWFVLSTTALLLTKESGLALIATYFFFILILPFIDKSITFKERLKTSGIVLIPVFIAFLWFLLQRFKLGWFLFPDHVGMLSFKSKDISDKLSNFFTFVFNREGRMILIIPLLLMLLDQIIRKIFSRHCEFTKQSILRMRLLHFVRNDGELKYDKTKLPFIIFALSFLLIYFIFSSINYFTTRYLLFAFPMFFIIISYYLSKLFETYKYYPAIIILSVYTIVNVNTQIKSTLGDCCQHYVDHVYIQKQIIDYLRTENKNNQKTYASFVFCHNMTSYYSGFVKLGEELRVTNHPEEENVVYWVHNNMEYFPDEENLIKSKGGVLIKTLKYNKASADIYKKTK